jgi:hypothetical protein
MPFRTWFVLFGFLVISLGTPIGSVSAADVIPSGTTLNVRTAQPVDADSSQPGMHLEGIVDDPVTIGGRIVIPRGTPATLEIVRVERSSNMKGRDRLTFKVRSIHVEGRTYPVSTSHVEFKGPSEGKRATRKVVGGAGIGAALGGIFGGGTGAAIGAATGGATGAIVAGSGKTHLTVPAETLLQFRFDASARINR